MKNGIQIKKDSHGDIFVSGYNSYMVNHNDIACDHLQQLCKNYETAFGEMPTSEQLDAALSFCYMLLAEIGEMHPGTHAARNAQAISALIGSTGLETAENIATVGRCIDKRSGAFVRVGASGELLYTDKGEIIANGKLSI